MKTEKTIVSFRVTSDVYEAIQKAAKSERRPIAHFVELAIEQLLIQRGFLKQDQIG